MKRIMNRLPSIICVSVMTLAVIYLILLVCYAFMGGDYLSTGQVSLSEVTEVAVYNNDVYEYSITSDNELELYMESETKECFITSEKERFFFCFDSFIISKEQNRITINTREGKVLYVSYVLHINPLSKFLFPWQMV